MQCFVGSQDRWRRSSCACARAVVTRVVLGLVGVTLSGCAVSHPWAAPDWALEGEVSGSAPPSAPATIFDPADLDARLLLIGDAGRATPGEDVLKALAAEASSNPARTWILFLGDNIYPDGLPPEAHEGRAEAVRRLQAQIDAVAPTGAQVIFLPGNHDYAHDGWAGWERERIYIEGLGLPNVSVRPSAGCPGPDTIDAGTRLRLVLLDTQWWFQDPPKPVDPSSHCPYDRADEIVAGLDSALAGAGSRLVVVAAHHPLSTHGHHGGFFSWKDHIFPLRAAASWAWVPLPIVGSLYPLSRELGITEQDLMHDRYRNMRLELRAALLRHPPLAFAAGHEHTLQVLEGDGPRLQVVSGAGTVDRADVVGRGDDTLFACGCAGFVRMDILRDGRAWVEVTTVDDKGRTSRPAGRWIEGASSQQSKANSFRN
jgi:hypothetical protein